jgi:hypothetical protein
MARIAPFSRTRIVISGVIGLTAFVVFAWMVWSDPPGDTSEAIREVDSLLEKFARGHARDISGKRVVTVDDLLNAPSWEQIERVSDRLTWSNEQIAKARAMTYLDSNPDPYSPNLWQKRLERAKESFTICNTPERIFRSVRFGALALALSVPLSWLMTLLLSWFWYFFLDRVYELSSAVRSKRNGDEA